MASSGVLAVLNLNAVELESLHWVILSSAQPLKVHITTILVPLR